MKKGSWWGKWVLGAAAALGITVLGLAVPSPAGAQGGGFQVSLYTGSSGYTVPIVVPPGTNGLQPDLALAYHSDNGNDWIGLGWGLAGLGFIERRGPNWTAAPTYTSSDTYVLGLGKGVHKLLYAGQDPSGTPGNYYRTQTESFLRIEGSSGWTVTDKRGTRYYFRYPLPPPPPPLPGGGGSGERTRAWYLDEVQDTHGNSMTISYVSDPNTTDTYPPIYPSTISYGGRSVAFTTESRPDPIKSYRSGSSVTITQRLKQIDVKLGSALVRRYVLGYTMSSATPMSLTQVSQLTSITEYGADGTSTLPSTAFIYHTPTGSTALTQVSITGGPSESLGNCTYVVDVNGDGLADVLVGNAGNYKWYRNQGNSSFAAATTIPNPTTPLPSLCTTTTEYKHESSYDWGFVYLMIVVLTF